MKSVPLPKQSWWSRIAQRITRRRAIFVASFVGLGCAVIVGVWYFLRPAPIFVVTVQQTSVEIALSVVGTIRPHDLVDVRSPNAGQIVSLFHNDGDAVDAQEPLGVIRYVVEKAQTDALRAHESAAKVEVARAQLAFDRTKSLFDDGFTSRATRDEAGATILAARSALAAAVADRQAAAARADEFTIRAPMAGIVLVRPIDNGQVVSPDTILFQLGSADNAEIYAEVDEIYADALHPGLSARAALSGTKTRFLAHISEVSPRVDSTTGGRLVKLVPENDLRLPPGRSVDVTIVVNQRPNTIVVPRQAVLNASTSPKVYVVDADNIIQIRVVTISSWPSLNAIIDSGLVANDRVVLTPTDTQPSTKVRPTERPSADAAPSGT